MSAKTAFNDCKKMGFKFELLLLNSLAVCFKQWKKFLISLAMRKIP